MITERHAEERIRSWLIATAPRHLPDRVLTDTYERTRRMAQASSVRTWWSRVTRPLPIVFAAGAIAVVVVPSASDWAALGSARTARWVSTREHGPDQRPMDHPCTAAFSVEFEKPEDEDLYWRAAVYDTYRSDRMEANRRGTVYDVSGGRGGARAGRPTGSPRPVAGR